VRTLPVLLPALAGFVILQVGKGGDAKFTETLRGRRSPSQLR
jgi:hypothetical protein